MLSGPFQRGRRRLAHGAQVLAPIERIYNVTYRIWYDRDKTGTWAIVDRPWGTGIIGWGGGGVYRSWYTWHEIVGDRIHLKVWAGTFGGTWEVWLYGRRILWATGPKPTEGNLYVDDWYPVPQVEEVSLYYENSEILFGGDTIRFYGWVKGTRTWDTVYRGLEWREVQLVWGPFADTLTTDRNGHYEITYEIPWGYSGSWYDSYTSCEGVTSAVRSIAIAWRTRIRISAPFSVRAGQSFDVTGALEHETGPSIWSTLEGKEVTVDYDGQNGDIGSTITGTDGGYVVTGVIYEKNHYILRAVFAGEELGVLIAAEARRDLVVEAPAIQFPWLLLPAAAIVVVAIAAMESK